MSLEYNTSSHVKSSVSLALGLDFFDLALALDFVSDLCLTLDDSLEGDFGSASVVELAVVTVMVLFSIFSFAFVVLAALVLVRVVLSTDADAAVDDPKIGGLLPTSSGT